MLKILIIEDEPLLAATLRHLIELNPLYSVTAIASDFVGALEAVDVQAPDLALVDLRLNDGPSGLNVAARLHEMDILCLLTTGTPPREPVPDVAIGCLTKPFNEEALVHALAEAEDILRCRRKLVRKMRLPEQLDLYWGSEVLATAPVVELQLSDAGVTTITGSYEGPSLSARIWNALKRVGGSEAAARAA